MLRYVVQEESNIAAHLLAAGYGPNGKNLKAEAEAAG